MAVPILAQKDFARVLGVVLQDFAVRRAWVYVAGGKCVIRATRRFKETKRDRRGELLVSYGKPNYAERKLIARLAKEGAVAPRGVQIKYWPAKKKKAKK